MREPLDSASLAALVDGTLDALFITSAEGEIQTWNQGAREMLGFTAQEAIGRLADELVFTAAGRATYKAALKEAVATGSAILELRAKKKSDEEVHVLLVLRKYGPGSGAPRLISVFRDMTEQTRLAQLLSEQIWSLSNVQDLLKSVLNNSSDYAIVGVDEEGRVDIWNEGARIAFGHEGEAVVGNGVEDLLFDPAEVQSGRLRLALAAARETGQFEDEFACVSREGRRFPARISIGRRQAPNGTAAGFVLIAKDVTDEKASGEALRRKTAFVALLQSIAMAANESKTVPEAMQRAVDEICGAMDWPIGHVYVRSGEWSGGLSSTKIWHLEEPERMDSFRRVTEASRLPPGECLPGRVLVQGKPLWIVDFPVEAGVARAKIAKEAGIRTALAAPVLVGTEIVAVLEFFSERRIDPDEQVLEVMGHVGSQLGRVVERTRAEEDRRLVLEGVIEVEHLREMDRFREEFIRTVSHELNAPITPIKLQLNMVKKGEMGPLNEAQAKAVGIIDRNVERLGLLVQDMLDVARIQAGQLKIFKQPTNLAVVIKEAVDLYAGMVDQSGVRLLPPEPPEEIIVDVDSRRLVQVLVNLVGNALKFTPPGGQVRIEARRKNGEVLVRVKDSGVGLTAEQLSRLFKPFGQVHDASQGRREGTGLGLFICKNLVEQHGGRIGAESDGPGKGSVFWFTLPMQEKIPFKDAPAADNSGAAPVVQVSPPSVQVKLSPVTDRRSFSKTSRPGP